MYRQILVPLDGSELAETALGYAKELAGRLDINVTLLHVSSPASKAFIPMERAYIQHTAETLAGQIEQIQKKSAAKSKFSPVSVRAELLEGYSAEEILKYAEAHSIDLIVMGSHGRSGVKRWALGSVASKVMSATKIPVWLIKPGKSEEIPFDKWPSRTFIVPLDGSELAEKVISHVEAFAAQRGDVVGEIRLVRVVEPLNLPTYNSPDEVGTTIDITGFIQQEMNRRKKSAKEYLAKMEQLLKSKGLSVKSDILEGKPGDELVEYANKLPFSMIIMATHGRSGISRLVYGNVAINILHGVSRPMLVIRPH